MIAKLRSNFKLTDILVRILFVLAFVFANWQMCLAATVLVFGSSNLWVALAVALALGTGLMFLLPVLVNLVLNWSRIVSVPRAEYCLFAHIFVGLGCLICGILNLVNLFTPLFLVWGRFLFPFVSTVIAALCFYKVTSKLYFNDVTRPFYFKVCMLVFLISVVIVEVL